MKPAFMLWCGCFFLLLLLGLSCFLRKKQVGFFANADPFPVSDVRGYNRACGICWIAYSLIGMVCGLPLLGEENPARILLMVLFTALDTLGLILLYVLVIEKKFQKK